MEHIVIRIFAAVGLMSTSIVIGCALSALYNWLRSKPSKKVRLGEFEQKVYRLFDRVCGNENDIRDLKAGQQKLRKQLVCECENVQFIQHVQHVSPMTHNRRDELFIFKCVECGLQSESDRKSLNAKERDGLIALGIIKAEKQPVKKAGKK